jgi:hypothetical protein
MIIECIRILDAGVRNATIGLAVQLAAVPRESGDSVPATPTIYNEAEHGEAARESFPDGAGPYLLINTTTLDQSTPQVRPVQNMKVGVSFRYLLRSKDSEVALRTASYTMRALMRTMAHLITNPSGNGTVTALKSRNQCSLYNLDMLQGGILSAPLDDTPVSWALTYTASMRDDWANT